MALPPTIPTSFVPHPTPGSRRQFSSSVTGVFPVAAYSILAIAVVLAIGAFIYGRVLASEQASQDAALTKAEANIDPSTVEQFIRLRDRITASESLLAGHAAVSGFFNALEKTLPASVRLSTLHVTLGNTTSDSARVTGTGFAKSFNALAAASDAFAKDGSIKDVIFSNMSVLSTGLVAFQLSASIDPGVTSFSPSAYATQPLSQTGTTTTP